VLVASVDGQPQPNPAEVLEYRWTPWHQVAALSELPAFSGLSGAMRGPITPLSPLNAGGPGCGR
jgi:isopentenyldiphosphate isomerase